MNNTSTNDVYKQSWKLRLHHLLFTILSGELPKCAPELKRNFLRFLDIVSDAPTPWLRFKNRLKQTQKLIYKFYRTEFKSKFPHNGQSVCFLVDSLFRELNLIIVTAWFAVTE